MRSLMVAAALATVAGQAQAQVTTVWDRSFTGATAVSASDDFVLVTLEGNKYVILRAANGRQLFEIENCRGARFSRGTLIARIVIEGEERLEGRNPENGAVLWTVQTAREAVPGDLIDDFLFYSDRSGVHRYRLSSNILEESRPIQWGWGTHQVFATRNRLCFLANGHEVYGLNSMNLARGWRYYCDARPGFVDESGFIGTGTIGFHIVSIGNDATRRWECRAYIAEDTLRHQFIRQPPAVTNTMVIIGGESFRSEESWIHVISPYLFGLNRETGQVQWRVPMIAHAPVAVKGNVAVLAAPRRAPGLWSVNGNPIHRDHRVWLQIRNPETGTLVWQSNELGSTQGSPIDLTSGGDRLFLLHRGRIRAYAVR